MAIAIRFRHRATCPRCALRAAAPAVWADAGQACCRRCGQASPPDYREQFTEQIGRAVRAAIAGERGGEESCADLGAGARSSTEWERIEAAPSGGGQPCGAPGLGTIWVAQVAAGPPPAPKATAVHCSGCGAGLPVSPETRTVRCAHCGLTAAIPAALWLETVVAEEEPFHIAELDEPGAWRMYLAQEWLPFGQALRTVPERDVDHVLNRIVGGHGGFEEGWFAGVAPERLESLAELVLRRLEVRDGGKPVPRELLLALAAATPALAPTMLQRLLRAAPLGPFRWEDAWLAFATHPAAPPELVGEAHDFAEQCVHNEERSDQAFFRDARARIESLPAWVEYRRRPRPAPPVPGPRPAQSFGGRLREWLRCNLG